jgi:NAD(P)-dependent dehydrogenase (short-subunit alcohol dehydrogenase family)
MLPVVAELDGQVALVTGGGRGIGANIARELAAAGMRAALSGRTPELVEAVAREIDGLGVVGDVSRREDAERMVAETERELGPIALLVNNAGISGPRQPAWQDDPQDWWHVFEVNVLGAFQVIHAALPGMIERARGRIVNVSSGASYLPPTGRELGTAYGPSKAALSRFTELLAAQARPHGVFAFHISPGLVRSDMTEGAFPDDAPWTPPELAPRLVVAIASGKLDRLAGRYIHAEHDDPDDLAARGDEVVEQDLNAIRLRR